MSLLSPSDVRRWDPAAILKVFQVAKDQTSHYNDGLTLGSVDVRSVKDGAAALNVCYTYNHFWYVNAENTEHAAAASQLTVQLVDMNNNWYLHGITDDHVVPSCGASNS